jgi:hypothetical protein
MSGFEYTAAVGMIYENDVKNGLLTVRNIRSRFDGEKRNPYNEPECGHHYARAMASWSLVPALTGFEYNGYKKQFTISDNEGTYFWSNGYSWGTYTLSGKQLKISCFFGKLEVNEFIVGKRKVSYKQKIFEAGKSSNILFH